MKRTKNDSNKGEGSKKGLITDDRFSRVHYDPRFKRESRKSSKIVLDSRFADLLKTDEFSKYDSNLKINKYGQPLKDVPMKENLSKYYSLGSGESEEESSGKPLIDPARGVGVDTSSSESEDLEDAEAREELSLYEKQTNENLEMTDEITNRLALVNQDWDHVKTPVIYKIVSSFLQDKKNSIKSVSMYLSDFGKEKIHRELIDGPPKQIFSSKEKENKGSNPKGDIDKEELRKYLLERFKYYYIIIEFDSRESARMVYTECDGMEIEKSSNIIDLRYVPDNMVFQDEPVEVTTEPPKGFQGADFTTSSLQLSNVKFDWDRDDKTKFISKKFTEKDLEEMDFKAYLASPSESGDEDEDCLSKKERVREKYKALIDDSEEVDVFQRQRENKVKVTFKPAFNSENSNEVDECEDIGEGESLEDSNSVTSSSSGPPEGDEVSENVQISVTKKVRDTRKNRKEEQKEREALELLMMDDTGTHDASKEHFSVKQVLKNEKMQKSKGRHKKKIKKNLDPAYSQPSFKIDPDDDRFGAFFQNHNYAPDPTCPQYKLTKGMKTLLDKRAERNLTSCKNTLKPEIIPDQPSSKPISLLVESLKKKARKN